MKWLLPLILLLATGVRLFGLDTYSYWTDELCSLSDAMGWGLRLDAVPPNEPIPAEPVCTRLAHAEPFARVVPGVARLDVHPPLYFVALRLWVECFGETEWATRSLSVLFSVLGIVALHDAVRMTGGPAAALRAALICAVAVSAVQFAQEVRNYAPAVTFTAAAASAVLRVGRSATIRSASLLAVFLLCLPLTHYYAVTSAAAICLHGAVSFRGRARSLTLCAASVAAVIYLAAWGPSLYQQLHHLGEHAYWLDDGGPGRLPRLAQRLCRLPVRYVVDTETFKLPVAATTVLGGLMLLALPAVYWRRPTLRLWVLLAAAPVAEVALFDLVGRTAALSWVRYSLTASPAVFVLIASAVPRGRWSMVPTAVAVLAALASLPGAYTPVWKVADIGVWVRAIDRTHHPGDGLVIANPDPITGSITYAAFQHYGSTVPDPAVILTRPATAQTLDVLRPCGQVYVVWQWPDRSVGDVLPGFIPESVDGIPNVLSVYRGRFRSGPDRTSPP